MRTTNRVMHSKYIIIGSSHAALEAATAIRLVDADGTLTLLTRDSHLPYSPTILPYVVSGRSQPDNVVLRDHAYFRDNAIAFMPGTNVVAVDPAQSRLGVASGETWRYDRLLIATGAAPALPLLRGLADVPFHVLRSMDDAIDLRQAIGKARSAIVLGRRSYRHARRRKHGQGQHCGDGRRTAAARARRGISNRGLRRSLNVLSLATASEC